MKIKKVSNTTYEISYKDKVIGTVDKYDLERLFNAQIGCSLNYY